MNLQNWISQAKKHWQEFQPNKYQALKNQGTLDLALKKAAEQTLAEVSELENQGYQPDEAFQMVRENHLFPPGEPENDNPEGNGPAILSDALQIMSRTLEADSPEDLREA